MKMRTIVYRQVDGLSIKADLYAGAGDGPRPTVMYLHGGALIFGNRRGQRCAELLTTHGINCFSVDYRLAPETKLVEIVEDVGAAWRYFYENANDLDVDSSRMAVAGSSAGGYLALIAGYRCSPRPKAIVSLYGYGNISGAWYGEPSEFYRTTKPMVEESKAREGVGHGAICEDNWAGERLRFYLYCRQQGIWPVEIAGADLHKSRGFEQYEPLLNVDADYPPTMLLHGEADTDVPFEQSVLMQQALEACGVKNEFISQPHWGHGFDSDSGTDPTITDAHRSIIEFLNEQLRIA